MFNVYQELTVLTVTKRNITLPLVSGVFTVLNEGRNRRIDSSLIEEYDVVERLILCLSY